MASLVDKLKTNKWYQLFAAKVLILGMVWQGYTYINNFYEEARPDKTFLEKTQVTSVAANGVVYIHMDVPANFEHQVSMAIYIQDSPAYFFKFDELPRGSFSVSVPFPVEAFGQPLIDLDVIWTVEHWTSFIEDNKVYVGLDVEVSDGQT